MRTKIKKNEKSSKYIILFFSLIINLSIIKSETNYVYFPLKPKDDAYLKSINNITEIMKYIYLEPLISEIAMGDPEQKVNFIFRTDCYYVYLTSKNHKTKKLDSASNYINKKFGDFSYYNPKESNSIYNYEQIKNYSYPYYNQFISKNIFEKFKINGIVYNSNMTLAEYIELEEPGGFCLQISEDDPRSLEYTPSFPVILKKHLNIINNYNWFIYYSQDNKNDYLVIGTSPDKFKNPKTGDLIYSNFEKEKNYFTINDEFDVRKVAMRINFDDIYLLDNDKKTKIEFEEKDNYKGRLIPNIGFIVGTTNYLNYIKKNIFEKYIQTKQCKKEDFAERPNLVGEEYTYFYCEESLYDTMKSLFKKIIFKQASSLSENFELNFNDVFIKQNNYLIFKIIFSKHLHSYWDLGKPFMKKYQFEFDFDHEKIGYYKLPKSEEGDNNILKYFLISFGVVILSAILITLGVFLGRNYFKLRKKRANELDDDFDYQQNKEVSPIINED